MTKKELARFDGVRFNTNGQPPSVGEAPSPLKNRADEKAQTTIELIEALACMANTTLSYAPASRTEAILLDLREALHGFTPYDLNLRMSVRMPMRVWLALVSWFINPKALTRHTSDLNELMAPKDFGTHIDYPGMARIRVMLLDVACDLVGSFDSQMQEKLTR